MKRVLIILSLLLLFVIPVFALEPLTELQLSSAVFDPVTGYYLYDGNYYDSAGYPVDIMIDNSSDNEIVNDDLSIIEDDSDDTSTESDNSSTSDSMLIHQEETSGTTQVNVFAIQTEDDTGGAWVSGGSGDSLVEQLFGPYTPYNASGIASVDWAWIADVTLFAILIICFFKIVAGVIKRV